jgi:hypothetical protein
MAKFFADAGLNIVTDKDAKCVIVYDGYITMFNPGVPDPQSLVQYEVLAQKPSVPYALPPLLSEANASADMEKSVNHMSVRDGWYVPSTTGKIAAITVGAISALLPIGAFTSVMSGNAVMQTAGHINASKNTPLGLAHAGIVIKRKDWIGYTQLASLNVYAAATTTESPAALLRAAVNGGVAELQAKEDVYYHREPKKVEAATTAASAPVAAPVSVESAASAPAPAQVVSDASAN